MEENYDGLSMCDIELRLPLGTKKKEEQKIQEKRNSIIY